MARCLQLYLVIVLYVCLLTCGVVGEDGTVEVKVTQEGPTFKSWASAHALAIWKLLRPKLAEISQHELGDETAERNELAHAGTLC